MIAAAAIAKARATALDVRRRIVDVLEEESGLDPDGFTARLAATLRLQSLSMERAHLVDQGAGAGLVEPIDRGVGLQDRRQVGVAAGRDRQVPPAPGGAGPG